jgi:cob(I)alamin adenosyltransferase
MRVVCYTQCVKKIKKMLDKMRALWYTGSDAQETERAAQLRSSRACARGVERTLVRT